MNLVDFKSSLIHFREIGKPISFWCPDYQIWALIGEPLGGSLTYILLKATTFFFITFDIFFWA